jgi:hypothetical protein
MIRLVVAVVVGCLWMTGCGTSPERRWAAASDVLSAAQLGVIELNKQGLVSDEEFMRIDVAVVTGRRALQIAESRLPEGGVEFEEWMEVARLAIDKLVELEKARLR